MTALYWVLGFIALQRLTELALARRNTARLLAEGGRELGAGHYPVMVSLHAGWLAVMAVFIPAHAQIWVPAFVLFVLLQCGRVWVIWSLGRFWTTRVITLDDAPLAARGPYRFIRHPNYLIVVAEIATVPMIFWAWEISIIFSVLNAILLNHRIRVEERALRTRRDA
ncbi:MAG: isoprenylcysteine carboxylmethyltransferase family protein [Alphaproteobacteria bacterium]|nr:isoprenylcysteine carboxylmethyltransferase family protein [Alphaproteobacteria bacterium]MCZ6764032.1 isoprenylcysteine carboxylmethyltransferase family protein [Alphaproteobacteria bacterium]